MEGPCSERNITEYEAKIDDLSEQEIFDFLSLTKAECTINSAFKAHNNAILFEILEKHSAKLSVALHKLSTASRELVLSELASPANDNISLSSLRQQIRGTDTKLIKRALNIAVARGQLVVYDTIHLQSAGATAPQYPTLTATDNYADDIDLNGDGIQDLFVVGPDLLGSRLRVKIALKDKNAALHFFQLNVPGDDLLWVDNIELVPKGQFIAPTLIDDDTGDILGIDVEASFLLKAPAIIMTPAESEGALVIYFEGSNLRHLYL